MKPLTAARVGRHCTHKFLLILLLLHASHNHYNALQFMIITSLLKKKTVDLSEHVLHCSYIAVLNIGEMSYDNCNENLKSCAFSFMVIYAILMCGLEMQLATSLE